MSVHDPAPTATPPLPSSVWTPTRAAALARLHAVDPEAYAQSRNHLQGAVSGLSPYLTHGVLTLPEALTGVNAESPLPVTHKWVYELGWRAFFRHVWQHREDGIFESLHAGPLPDDAYARELPTDFLHACTGVPVVDQAVRQLYATGWLHNHARMWLASYVVHVRKVHWRSGADWMVSHLLDGDLASNHLSWQWVAGTGSIKPYVFNAENVARFAPPDWHSPGTVVDQSYEVLTALAFDRAAAPPSKNPAQVIATPRPQVHTTPPPALGVARPGAGVAQALAGRSVWLVHPWALRVPPADLPRDTVVMGVYLASFHAQWPWTAARWLWVDTLMRAICPTRYWVDPQALTQLLAHAARVRTTDDPHVAAGLPERVERVAPARLFADVPTRCGSFSQWWRKATQGVTDADALWRQAGETLGASFT